MSTNDTNEINETAIFGNGLWLERNNQEWIILRSLFRSDLYLVKHYLNRLVLELYASIDEDYEGADEYPNDEIIARLFSKIHPRNTEQGEQQ